MIQEKRMMIKEGESSLGLSDVAFPEEEGFQSSQIGISFFIGNRGMLLRLCNKSTACCIYICNSVTKEVCRGIGGRLQIKACHRVKWCNNTKGMFSDVVPNQ